MDVVGRRICVLAAPGDRRDEDVRDIARIAAGVFDRYICRRDDFARGRGPDEIPQLLRETLIAEGVGADTIDVIPDESTAVDAGLRSAEPGDLLVLFADALTRTWKQIIGFESSAQPVKASTSDPVVVTLPDAPEFEIDMGDLLRDERGVRLAREAED